MKKHGLSGLIPSRNALSQDYCLVLSVKSLLPICDEVIVSDAESDDGTREMLAEWQAIEPKLRVVDYKWPDPKGSMTWFTDWLNDLRGHAKYSSICQLDADEVLTDDPEAHRLIGKAVAGNAALAVDRLNFVRDARSLIPEGECCGKFVVRIGPSDMFLASDEPHVPGEVPMLDMATIEPNIRIYHLGFLRDPKAYFAKARVVLGAFFNEFDVRLAEAEANGKPPMSGMPWWDRVVPYNGYYPEAVKKWMQARRYNP